MTFTEAAVEVLRLVGKPLHYKQITEIAIERNLLSHVGKTPEITMSSRLATMVKKDRGEAPIVKVKPGVFGLRDFPEDVLSAAESESGRDYELPEEPAAAAETAAEPEEPKASRASSPKLPGADVFPEEEDDDVPILAALDDESADEGEEGEAGKRRKRRRRRRRRGEGEEREVQVQRERAGRHEEQRSSRSRDDRSRRDERVRGRRELTGDWHRDPPEGELVGKDLADAIEAVLGSGRRAEAHVRIAELLVRRGRLAGDPSALAPTVASALRGDVARRRAEGRRPRFRVDTHGRVGLTDWAMTDEALRAEHDALRAAERQRDQVRRAFLRLVEGLPTAGLMELIAAWLNTEGVTELRAVRRPGSTGGGQFHLAGTLRRGAEQSPWPSS